MLTSSSIINIVLLSLFAGLGTSLGGGLAVFCRPSRRVFGFLMGITAGVMIALSFLELVAEAWELQGYLVATAGFAAGAFFMFFLDFFAPHIRFGEQELRNKYAAEALPEPNVPRYGWFRRGMGRGLGRGGHRRFLHQRNHITDRRLLKTGLLLAVGITVHNIPEGIAVGAGYMHQPEFGYFIAIAILLHNIPEGIATALPLYKSGVCRWDAFRVASLSGLAEPLGALLASLFLTSFDRMIPAALAFAGGVMVFITLDELIPAAREHGHQHAVALGIILGSIFVLLLSGIFGI